MRKLALAILFFSLAPPAWATTYYLATAAGGGSDSNNGTSSGTPWLTPNHAVNCGDVITAAAGAYAEANLSYNSWGTVTCAAGNNVAWVKCATFDACTVAISGTSQGIDIDQSYWGIQGFEVDSSATTTMGCLAAWPGHHYEIHHIIFANNIANGCGGTGLGQGSYSATVGVDYFVAVGNIVYNTARDTGSCFSGISIYNPIASDTLPGTHYYIAGNFSWGNTNPATCGGGPSTDGDGITLDDYDGTLTGGTPFTQQTVVDNNISIFNGGPGVQLTQFTTGSGLGYVYFRHNTLYGNSTGTQANHGACGEFETYNFSHTESFYDLAQTSGVAAGCDSQLIYAFYTHGADGTDHVYNDWGYSAAGYNDGSATSTGFSYGPNNTFGTNPSLSNPVNPGAPSCSSASSVPNCMATVIANFTPTTAAAVGYGYQKPSTTPTYDPLFPQWLCNVNLPAGLVTMGCLALSSLPASVTITGVKVQ